MYDAPNYSPWGEIQTRETLCPGAYSISTCLLYTSHSRGSACFCVDLYTGKESRYERMDILGIMEPEKLPGWAKHGLLTVQQERAKKEQHKGEKEAR